MCRGGRRSGPGRAARAGVPWPATAAARWCGRRRSPPGAPALEESVGRRPQSGPPPPRCRTACRRCRRRRPPGPARRAARPRPGCRGATGASPGARPPARSGRRAGSWCRRRTGRRPPRCPSRAPRTDRRAAGRRWRGRRSGGRRWRRPARRAPRRRPSVVDGLVDERAQLGPEGVGDGGEELRHEDDEEVLGRVDPERGAGGAAPVELAAPSPPWPWRPGRARRRSPARSRRPRSRPRRSPRSPCPAGWRRRAGG